MKNTFYALLAGFIVLTSCNQKASLDKYFVESAKNKNFVSLDVSPAMFNTAKSKLSAEQVAALQSFEKMNILYFKKNATNTKDFEAERLKVKTVLQDEIYQDLMRYGMGKDGATISFVGTEKKITEFIISGSKNDVGLGLVRITGKDMKPEDVLKIMQGIQSGNFDMAVFKPIFDMVKK